MVRWHLLPSLGKLLFSLAQMLAASEYKEHYRRDLGPAALQAASQGRPASLLLVAFAMHASLHEYWFVVRGFAGVFIMLSKAELYRHSVSV